MDGDGIFVFPYAHMMDKAFTPSSVEEELYARWEREGAFVPVKNAGKKPFTVILPPPNANANLHLGHAMYVVEDIMVRYHRMKGDPTLWLPGADHAGFETQFVYEKHLAKQGKSRFDFGRDELYRNIWDFVHQNRGIMEGQLKRLGFSLDWSRLTFTLDPQVVSVVYKTFKRLYDDGLVYRGMRLVNYCTKCGTGFSDLEVKHVEQKDPLYYMKYGPFLLATVRPETKFGDTAVAVHPSDKRYKDWVGKDIEFEGLTGTIRLKVVADEAVDPSFGTGVVKVTPAHDPTDFEIGKRHGLPAVQVIGFDGKLMGPAGPYAGMRVRAARAKVVDDLTAKGLIDHVDQEYVHTVGTCYKCGTTLEPLPMAQWFVKVAPLAANAVGAIKKKEVSFVPKRFEKTAIQWLTNFHDWNISRQCVWGMRIPAFKCTTCPDHWVVTDGPAPTSCDVCGGTTLVQDEDTFDTWFSSGQWPFATLLKNDAVHGITGPESDFETFYPTSVMETGYDILPWWVCRMLMLGLYATGKVPFTTVYLHGLVRDAKGQKMSKSKGNVVDPIEMVTKYGADALRMTLVFGTAAGNDQCLSEDKIRGMRNFANKLWNMSRFFVMNLEEAKIDDLPAFDRKATTHENDAAIVKELDALTASVTRDMEKYRYSDAAQKLYDFAWHTVADVYIEANKERFRAGDTQALACYRYILTTLIAMLHPFMPFVTEAIWGTLPGASGTLLTVSPWPAKSRA